MGVNSSSEKRCNTQNYSSIYDTPPKTRSLARADRFGRLQFDPRSPTGLIDHRILYPLISIILYRWHSSNTNPNEYSTTSNTIKVVQSCHAEHCWT